VDTIALGNTVMITADFECTIEEAVDGNMFPRQSLYNKDGVTLCFENLVHRYTQVTCTACPCLTNMYLCPYESLPLVWLHH
jgi:hypothetical protein